MKRILKKLRSQGGASLLLALLFLLLCGMVGASLLAASASNAGRLGSSRKEQQRYFALSSALQLVCERLKVAEYTAKARMVTTGSDPVIYQYKQEPGTFTFSTDTLVDDKWRSVLPLLPELDWLFARTFHDSVFGADAGAAAYVPLDSGMILEPAEHVLKIGLDLTGVSLGLAEELEGLQEKVEITIHLGKGSADCYRLYLTADLKDSADKTVMTARAELDPEGTEGRLPDITVPGVSVTSGDVSDLPAETAVIHMVKWKPARIYKIGRHGD